MFESPASQERVGRFAWVMAWFGLVAGQFHAMARHQTDDGKSDLELPLTRAWSDPARDLFQPLLDWADPDIVYLTWGKIWLPVFLGFTLCAFLVHRQRQPVGFERWAWRIALAGYAAGCVSVAAEYWTAYGSYNEAIVDGVFPLTLAAMLTMIIGSTMLGVSLWRRGFRPRAVTVLLSLMIPALIVIPEVTSMGSVVLPVAFAFGILGRRLATESVQPSGVAAAVSA